MRACLLWKVQTTVHAGLQSVINRILSSPKLLFGPPSATLVRPNVHLPDRSCRMKDTTINRMLCPSLQWSNRDSAFTSYFHWYKVDRICVPAYICLLCVWCGNNLLKLAVQVWTFRVSSDLEDEVALREHTCMLKIVIETCQSQSEACNSFQALVCSTICSPLILCPTPDNLVGAVQSLRVLYRVIYAAYRATTERKKNISRGSIQCIHSRMLKPACIQLLISV